MAETPNVIHVKCKLGRCPYMVWFQWEDKNIDRSRDKKQQFEEPYRLTVHKMFCDYHDQSLHDKGMAQDGRSSDSE